MEEPKKKQTMRYSQEELILIKGVFAENDELLKSIRKVFYQLPLNAVDLSRLEITFKGKPGLQKVMRKMFLPEIEADLPLQQEFDFWMSVKLKEMPVSEGAIHLKSIKTWIDYIDQQLKVIETNKHPKKPKIKFKDLSNINDKTDWTMVSDMLARNTIVNQVEQQLQQLLLLAGMKEETPEQTVERLQRDSSK